MSDSILPSNGNNRTPPAQLDAALELAGLGIPVFPVWGVTDGVCHCGREDCDRDVGKHPIAKYAPDGYKSASTDLAWITKTWTKAPKANIGLNLVKAGLMVVGPDSPEWLQTFKERGLPETVTVSTGGGDGHVQYWYRRPADSPILRSCKTGKYDIISDGYAIGPGTHKSGNSREYIVSPTDLGIDHVSQLPEAPDWSVQMLVEAQTTKTDFEPVDPDEPPVRLPFEARERWHGRVFSYNDKGEVDRSMCLVLIGNALAVAGLTRRGIVDALRDRDGRLWEKPAYLNRTDTEKRYTEIADRALAFAGRQTDVADVADVTRSEESAREEDVAVVADVTRLGDSAREDGATLLDDLSAFLATYIAYPSDHARIAHTLWIAHAHAMDAWESTPRLALLSPEPASGKSRGLEVSNLLVPRPVEAMNVTPAYLFRKVDDDAGAPTILFDEVDTVFGPKAKDNEDVRAFLNAGHRRGAKAGRCVVVGQQIQTVEFPAYCAVALAGLGDLPDTILTRSVIIQMRRRKTTEKVTPFRRRVAEADGYALRDRLAAWSTEVRRSVAAGWPEMPAGVEDRDADVWEALLAVADAAGGEWPQTAREAAVALVNAAKEKPASLGIRLLTDLRTVFGPDTDAMATDEILTALHELPEAPWSEVNAGKPLNSSGLSRRLSGYGISSTTVRPDRNKKKPVRGYRREDLADAWDRYVPVVLTSAADDPGPPSEKQGEEDQKTDLVKEIRPMTFDSITGGAFNIQDAVDWEQDG